MNMKKKKEEQRFGPDQSYSVSKDGTVLMIETTGEYAYTYLITHPKVNIVIIAGGGGNMDCALMTCDLIYRRKIKLFIHSAFSAGCYYCCVKKAFIWKDAPIHQHGSGNGKIHANDSIRNAMNTYTAMTKMDCFDPLLATWHRNQFEELIAKKDSLHWDSHHPTNYWIDLGEIKSHALLLAETGRIEELYIKCKTK